MKGVKGFPQLSHTRTREKVRGNPSLPTPDLPAELLELDQRAREVVGKRLIDCTGDDLVRLILDSQARIAEAEIDLATARAAGTLHRKDTTP